MNAASQTDSYLNLFLSFAAIDPITVLSAFFLSLGRLIPIMTIAPFFGAKTVPGTARMMFSVAIVAMLFPQILFSIKGQIAMDVRFLGFFVKEVGIGFILATLVTIPFYVAQSSGSLVDHMRGAQSLQVSDPTTSGRTGPMGLFYNYVLITIFFFIGGPFFFIDALGKSYHLIPVDQYFNPNFFSMSIPLWKLIVGLLSYVLSMSIQLAAPPLIGILMGEMFLGIANRLAPQVQIVFLGISLKSWLGLALLAAAWYLIMQQLGKESENWLRLVDDAIRQATPK